ncbi:hypothetical protein ZIOFF_038083 [Zingiber officinale]|uniref:EamA domain-containing protein n=1 Tax=Zingiber officinale TaxID=94328 RepID=A0A8J5KZZ2_ZINOF|nr:hypothetical protein ZIOFF_038083 [Zingiber officinale]
MALAVDSDGSGRGFGGGEIHVVEMAAESSSAVDEVSPLLAADGSGDERPRMTIFSVSYPRKKPAKESAYSSTDTEINFLVQIVSWIWSGSRHSGILCVCSSSIIYSIIEVLLDIFPDRSSPVYQTLFTRCSILFIVSLLWLRRTGHPLCIPTHAKTILLLRSLTGSVSLLSFIYSVQNLPVSYAVMLNFATPIMASLGAIIILREKLPLPYIGGLVCSFLGLFLIFQPVLLMGDCLANHLSSNQDPQNSSSASTDLSSNQDPQNSSSASTEILHHTATSLIEETALSFFTFHLHIPIFNIGVSIHVGDSVTNGEKHALFAILIGIFSTILGGVSYCLVRAGAKATDQPMYTVLSFAILALPLSAILILVNQEFVVPDLFTFLLAITLGVLAFLAEVLLARGLHLDKIAKTTNVLYLKVLLSQMWSLIFKGASPTLNKLIGCLLILASICGTSYIALEKEND